MALAILLVESVTFIELHDPAGSALSSILAGMPPRCSLINTQMPAEPVYPALAGWTGAGRGMGMRGRREPGGNTG